jgi:hypothetical protein
MHADICMEVKVWKAGRHVVRASLLGGRANSDSDDPVEPHSHRALE